MFRFLHLLWFLNYVGYSALLEDFQLRRGNIPQSSFVSNFDDTTDNNRYISSHKSGAIGSMQTSCGNYNCSVSQQCCHSACYASSYVCCSSSSTGLCSSGQTCCTNPPGCCNSGYECKNDGTGSCISNRNQCFSDKDTVELRFGKVKLLQDVVVGDQILSFNRQHQLVYSPVIAIPHPINNISTEFIVVVTQLNKQIRVTPDHFLVAMSSPETCALLLKKSPQQNPNPPLTASKDLGVGSCVQTKDGWELIVSKKFEVLEGVYTVVTTEEFIVVSDIIASPFAINHAAASMLYEPLRWLHAIYPAAVQFPLFVKILHWLSQLVF